MNRASVPSRSRIALLMGAVLLAAGCGVNQPIPPGTVGPGASPTTPVPTLQPPASFDPLPSASPPDDTTGVLLDPTVLEILPVAIDGFPVQEDANEAANLLSTIDLGELAEAADAAVAVDTGGGNLVVAWVVRLRPDVFSEEIYRQWRDSYDEGACNAAGGVVGKAQAEIGGRNTYITSCVEPLRTYHVWLEDQDMLVSASSIGQGRFGEKLMAGLRVPE